MLLWIQWYRYKYEIEKEIFWYWIATEDFFFHSCQNNAVHFGLIMQDYIASLFYTFFECIFYFTQSSLKKNLWLNVSTKKKEREKSFVEDHRDSVLDYKLIAETLREMSFVVISSQTIVNTNIEK